MDEEKDVYFKEPKKHPKHKSGRGSVGRAFGRRKRYEDKEYKEKVRKTRRIWYKVYYQKNKKKLIKDGRRRIRELNDFANKRCQKCDKLLNHKNKSGLCRKHWIGRPRVKW